MHRPLVSILVNNFNYGRFLVEAIDSALNQTYQPVEVVVVDDGSTDNSHGIIASYGDRVRSVLKPNGGQGSTFNAGWAAAKGDIICFLDADDAFTPDKVARVVEVFQKEQGIGWVFHTLRLIDTTTGNELPRPDRGATRRIDFREPMRQGKQPNFAPATSGLCFTRELLGKVLPMPELEGTSADRFLKLAALAQADGMYLDEPLVVQKIHGKNAFTLQGDKQRVGAKSLCFTSYWMRTRFPHLSKFSNKMFGMGLGTYWKTGGVDPKYRHVVDEHLKLLTPAERLGVYLRAFRFSNPVLTTLGRWRLKYYKGHSGTPAAAAQGRPAPGNA